MNLHDTLELTKVAIDTYRTIILTEGISDMLAVSTLARRLDIDLDTRRIAIVAMGGATNIGHFLDLLIPYKQAINIAGLYDLGEAHHFRRALESAGFASDLTRSDLETLGFYGCDRDLEEELIRAVGVESILKIADEQGELGAFRKLQMQAVWQDRSTDAQLHRWLGAGSTRKIRYAELLVNALDLSRVPTPLDGLLKHISCLD